MTNAETMIAEIIEALKAGKVVRINKRYIEGTAMIATLSVDKTGHPCYRGKSIKYADIAYYVRRAG